MRSRRAWQAADKVRRSQLFDGLLGKVPSGTAGIFKKPANGRFALIILGCVSAKTLFGDLLGDGGKLKGLSTGGD